MSNRNDFSMLRAALVLEGKPGTVPLVEFDVAPAVMSAFLGREVETTRDVVDFWTQAGYGQVPLSVGLLELGGVLSGDASLVKEDHYSLYSDEPVEIKWAAEHQGLITSVDELTAYPWPQLEDMDFSKLDELAELLPPQMKVVAALGKVFTAAWMLMGFETFCLATVEQPELVSALLEKTGSLQAEALEQALERDCVGAVLIADDIAYCSGAMVNPEILRTHVFPWFTRMADLCRSRDIPVVYHSDGCLYEVLEDLIACGFNALHPVEPQAMDGRKTKEAVEGRLCLLGGVDVDLLGRGTPDAVKEAARANIRTMGYDGAYALGSANSVPTYVPVENFRAMIEVADEVR